MKATLPLWRRVVYCLSMILLFGAEFTRAYSRRFEKQAVPPGKAAKKAKPEAEVPTLAPGRRTFPGGLR